MKSQTPQDLVTIDDESSEEEEDEEYEEIPNTISPTMTSRSQNRGNTRFKGTTSTDTKRLRQQSSGRVSRERQSPVSVDAQSPESRFGTPLSMSDVSPHNQASSTKSHKWKHLNASMREYLQFQQDSMTRYHYFLKLDTSDFIHNGFIDMALSFEPLLYAVIAFAAYHHTLRKEDGKFKDFWKYYCQSIMLLRKWLESHTERNEAVLFTILQLTTFEEYLGDWANLASHHRAAHSIFNALYTYDNVMGTAASRCIFDWLARTDVIAGLMAGATAVLSRTWFTIALEWHRSRMNQDALDASHAMPYFVAKLRLVGFDMTAVFANAATNPRTMQDIQDIATQMDELRLEMQSLHSTNFSTRDIPETQILEADSEHAFDPRIPLFRDDLWPLNFIWLDWYGTQQMHKYQIVQLHQAMQARAMSQGQAVLLPTSPQIPDFSNLPPELENLSIVQCQIYEAIEQYPHAPPGAILGCQASLGLSTLFLKKETKYIMWARRKLANLERLGYIWPPLLRKRMSQLWDDEEIQEWWLPNGDGKIPLLDEIRGVVEERTKDIEVRGGDDKDNLREMRALFEKMDFDITAARARKDSVWSTGGVETAGAGAHGPTSSPSESGKSDEADEHNHYQPRASEGGGGHQGNSAGRYARDSKPRRAGDRTSKARKK